MLDRPWWLLGAAPCLMFAFAWVIGRIARDEWMWSQLLFWLPAVGAALFSALGAAMAWRAGGRVGRLLAWLGLVCGVLSIGQVLHSNVGWAFGATARTPASAIASATARATIAHWNPRAPGERALECAAALAETQSDILIISNPGAMLRGGNAAAWVPPGWHVRHTAHIAIASRWPIQELTMIADAEGPPSVAVWVAWARLQLEGGRSIGVLVVDLPSSPQFPRGLVAQRVADALARHPDLPAPDLLVGDFNSVEGSVLFDLWSGLQPASPSVSCGWLGTFPRVCPVWRIDWMRAAPSVEFTRYETLDLGMGLHRAQRGEVALIR